MTQLATQALASVPPRRLVLLGHPVAHSLSPRFQNAALEAAGLRPRYEAVDATSETLDPLLALLARQHAGGNVTIPHKEVVSSRTDTRTAMAQRVGAVNTFWFEGGALVGHNTDVRGVERALAALLPNGAPSVAGATCAVLGAGGSAAAVLVALEMMHAGSVRMFNRTASRVHLVSDRVGVQVLSCSSAQDAVRGAAVVINATPVGLHDNEMPVRPGAISDGASVLDLVYRSGETAWVRACRARGLRAHDGLRMLVEQGAAAFHAWFGIEASREAMWRVLEARA